MRISSLKWAFLFLACSPAFACSSKGGSALPGGDDGGGSSGSGDDGSTSGSSGSSSGSSSGFMFMGNSDDAGVMVADSACKAGRYLGSFTGNYASSLILGIPLTVSGNVDLVLNQEGGDEQQCQVHGEFESCSNVFTLSNGTITGVANKAGMIGDATVGGYPYFCSMTGTLDCANKVLVDGWIQCTYCAFDQLTDMGTQCDGANIGGHFAGPLTANYDTTMHAFVMGTWNGAEALADAGLPGPDSGSYDNILALDGGYGFLGKFGGAGDWNATLQPK
jgi:hypothetical protein